jgi:hypothetical protein
MKHRKLRIAWSVAWGITALMLIAIWVKSYQRYYILDVYNPVSAFRIDSGKGMLSSTFSTRKAPWSYLLSTFTYDKVSPAPHSAWGFYAKSGAGRFDFDLPYWFVVFSATLAAFPWGFWHHVRGFSLRTLLIATTLIAAMLGLIVWLR